MQNVSQYIPVQNYPGVTIQISTPQGQAVQAQQPQQTAQQSQAQPCYPANYYTQNLAQPVIPKELVSALETIAKNTAKKETPKMEITDGYIKNLETYLSAQDTKLRLMAGKDIIARLQEDSTRKDNPALTALVNKMLQDPSTAVKSLSLSALKAGMLTGDATTKQILTTMTQQNSNSGLDAEDAHVILMRMPQ